MSSSSFPPSQAGNFEKPSNLHYGGGGEKDIMENCNTLQFSNGHFLKIIEKKENLICWKLRHKLI